MTFMTTRTTATTRAGRTALAAALAMGLTLGTATPARASGVPVFDASNLAQMLTQATTLAEQLTALQDQLDTLRQQYTTITNMYNEMRGITDHARMLANPVATLHGFFPADLDPADLLSGPLAALATSLRDAKETYSADELFGDAAATQVNEARTIYTERGDFIFSYMALVDRTYESLATRRANLETLATAAQTATTEKSVLDLQARIGAENALLLNDIAMLQVVDLMMQLERMSIEHNREGLMSVRPTRPNEVIFSE
jgi:type IV secretion system protein VirB5